MIEQTAAFAIGCLIGWYILGPLLLWIYEKIAKCLNH